MVLECRDRADLRRYGDLETFFKSSLHRYCRHETYMAGAEKNDLPDGILNLVIGDRKSIGEATAASPMSISALPARRSGEHSVVKRTLGVGVKPAPMPGRPICDG